MRLSYIKEKSTCFEAYWANMPYVSLIGRIQSHSNNYDALTLLSTSIESCIDYQQWTCATSGIYIMLYHIKL